MIGRKGMSRAVPTASAGPIGLLPPTSLVVCVVRAGKKKTRTRFWVAQCFARPVVKTHPPKKRKKKTLRFIL
jgi:hypothetical protein